MHPMINIAVKATRRAGDIMLRAQNELDRISIEQKSSAKDLVTSVDRACEIDIIETIHRSYPEHTIVGEESGRIDGKDQEVEWIIDPIDGTYNFAHGFPHFAVSIGVKIKDTIEHGVIYDPIRDEIFTATKGGGCQLNSRRIRVSNCKNIGEACLSMDGDLDKEQNMQLMNKIVSIAEHVRYSGSATLGLAYVAAGRLDGYLVKGSYSWDVAAGALMVREAGGFVSDWHGSSDFLDSRSIVVASPKVFPKLSELVAEFAG